MKTTILALGAACATIAAASPALASNGLESPENGVEQMTHGSAWVARADTPLAAYFNPAALAFQSTSVYVGAHLMFRKQCLTRLNEDGSPATPSPNKPAPGSGGVNGDGSPGSPTCADGGLFPNPQIGATIRLSRQVAIGFSFLGPHAYGKISWPESLPYNSGKFGAQQEPSPNRYMLTEADSKLIFPTIGVGFAVNDELSFGASFVWGIATLSFTTFSEAVSPPQQGTPVDDFYTNSDLKGQIKGKDLFIPGFVLGGLWSPAKVIDVGASYRWSDSINTATDLNVLSRYWTTGGKVNDRPCKDGEATNCNVTDVTGAGRLKFAIPMEARLGARFHLPRSGEFVKPKWADEQLTGHKVRDPLSQDVMDLELDFAWANNSAVDKLNLSFNPGIAVAGTPGIVPVNADIPHEWKDSFSVRAGGEYVIVPNLLAVRAGGWFETKSQPDAYLGLDFDAADKVGVSGGAVVRAAFIDIHAGYQHTFWGTLDNGGKGLVHGLSGDASAGNHTRQAINGGKLTTSLDEFGLSANAHF
jgi:long-chain fatty acid transport protein